MFILVFMKLDNAMILLVMMVYDDRTDVVIGRWRYRCTVLHIQRSKKSKRMGGKNMLKQKINREDKR